MVASERRAGGVTLLALVVCAIVASLSLATLQPGSDRSARHSPDGSHLGRSGAVVNAVRDVRLPASAVRRAGSLLVVAAGAALALVLVRFGSVSAGAPRWPSRIERRRNRTRAPPVTS
jgi:hypothetical protein